MFFHCGMIHSIMEQFILSWKKSFQSGMDHSRVVPEIGYETYSQNSGLIFIFFCFYLTTDDGSFTQGFYFERFKKSYSSSSSIKYLTVYAKV